MLKDLILRNRSYRRFSQDSIDVDTLKELINLARLSPSASNMQPLKYIISNKSETNDLIFQCLAWAGFLKAWDGPAEDERPAAYIVILHDTKIRKKINVDHGITAQSILLGAVEQGLGGCIIGSIDKKRLRKVLKIPSQYEILLVLALGKPKEAVVLEEMGKDGNIKYWRDEKDIHHVPKRKLDDIIRKL
jgi:nitroreductase